MKVSIVIGSYNRLAFLKKTVESIRKSSLQDTLETIIVDGGSTDKTIDWLVKQKDIITIVQHNRVNIDGKLKRNKNWGYFMNLGFKSAAGKYICMISDDSVLQPDALKNGVAEFERAVKSGKNVGAVAFYWRSWPEEKSYRVGRTLDNKLFVNHGLYLRDAVENVGWIEEEKYNFYHADGDLCLKLWRQGYEVIDCPSALVEHYEQANVKVRKSNNEQQQEDWQTYLKEWSGVYYDPNNPNIGSWDKIDAVPLKDPANIFPKIATRISFFKKK